MTKDSGKFTSANYPNEYNSTLKCSWEIKAPYGKNVKLSFVGDYALEPASKKNECLDYIEVCLKKFHI